MSAINAKMVATLREMTGLGMMECKKALIEADGDIKKAEEILRIKSGAKAGKVAGRVAAEGIVSSFISEDLKTGVLVEINCETDFVAKDNNFVEFTNHVIEAIKTNKEEDLTSLSKLTTSNGKTIEELRSELIAKLGENISIRRAKFFQTDGSLSSYLHGKKIGVMVDLAQENQSLGKDIAMHIAASKPQYLSDEQVSKDQIEAEKKIYTQQAASSGKSAEIVAKMVTGRISKYLAEITLLGQPFVKNPDVTIKQLLKQHDNDIKSFIMFTVGEGIEKKVVDYQAEVAAAAKV